MPQELDWGGTQRRAARRPAHTPPPFHLPWVQHHLIRQQQAKTLAQQQTQRWRRQRDAALLGLKLLPSPVPYLQPYPTCLLLPCSPGLTTFHAATPSLVDHSWLLHAHFLRHAFMLTTGFMPSLCRHMDRLPGHWRSFKTRYIVLYLSHNCTPAIFCWLLHPLLFAILLLICLLICWAIVGPPHWAIIVCR